MDTAPVTPGDTLTITDPDEVYARTAWAIITEPADHDAHQAITAAGGYPQALAALRDGTLPTSPTGLSVDRWRARDREQIIAAALTAAEQAGIRMLDPQTIPALAGLDDTLPHALWITGDPTALTTTPTITITGARAASTYGETIATDIATALADRGTTIHSGGAYGIDTAAHRGALAAGGSTVVWLGSGVDRPYPAGNRQLLADIASRPGCAVVSELPAGAVPTKWRLLQRARLIAAAASATVVVEAGPRSGSLIVAREASRLHRPVGAVPGPVTRAASAGCHLLIRDHHATLITGPDDAATLTGLPPRIFRD